MSTFEFEITIQSKSGDYSWPIVLRCKQLDGLTTHSSGILQLSQDDFYQLIQEQENEKAYGILLGKPSLEEMCVIPLSVPCLRAVRTAP